MRRTLALACAGLAVMTTAAAADEPAIERSVVDVAPASGKDFGALSIDNSLGDISVEGYDGNEISVTAVKRAPSREALERIKVSLIPEPSGSVMVTTRLRAGREMRPLPAGAIRVDLVIRAPRSALIRARTWNGTVRIAGVDNGAEAAANEGDITVRRVLGAVTTRSAQGHHQLADVVGQVEARALVGDVNLDWIRGSALEAYAHRGAIRARRISTRQVSLRTFEGDIFIALTVAPTMSVTARSHKGDIHISGSHAHLTLAPAAPRGEIRGIPASFKPLVYANGRVVYDRGDRHDRARIAVQTNLGDVVFAGLDAR